MKNIYFLFALILSFLIGCQDANIRIKEVQIDYGDAHEIVEIPLEGSTAIQSIAFSSEKTLEIYYYDQDYKIAIYDLNEQKITSTAIIISEEPAVWNENCPNQSNDVLSPDKSCHVKIESANTIEDQNSADAENIQLINFYDYDFGSLLYTTGPLDEYPESKIELSSFLNNSSALFRIRKNFADSKLNQSGVLLVDSVNDQFVFYECTYEWFDIITRNGFSIIYEDSDKPKQNMYCIDQMWRIYQWQSQSSYTYAELSSEGNYILTVKLPENSYERSVRFNIYPFNSENKVYMLQIDNFDHIPMIWRVALSSDGRQIAYAFDQRIYIVNILMES